MEERKKKSVYLEEKKERKDMRQPKERERKRDSLCSPGG